MHCSNCKIRQEACNFLVAAVEKLVTILKLLISPSHTVNILLYSEANDKRAAMIINERTLTINDGNTHMYRSTEISDTIQQIVKKQHQTTLITIFKNLNNIIFTSLKSSDLPIIL